MQPSSRRASKVNPLSLLGLILISTLPAAGENNTMDCLTGSPAIPVEQFRAVPGQGTFEMWPPNLRPADPVGQALPASRDSTLYTSRSDQLPGAGGLEIFHDFDILRDEATVYFYMAFNSGFQIWDITGSNATDPVLRSTRNGWSGGFQVFPDPPTEYYFPIWDIDAIDPEGAPGDTLIALSGEGEVGVTLWDASNKNGPFQLYQDNGKIGIQVATANAGGRTYAFFAVNNGVNVYDMTRAREIGPCFENTNVATSLCGGSSNPVWRGRLEPWPWARARFVDVLEAEIAGDDRLFVVASDGFVSNPLGVEIREITDITTLPPTNVARTEGLNTISTGVDLFEYADRYYLAAVNFDNVEVHDVTACLEGTPGCSLNNPRVDVPTKRLDINFVHFSESNGRPFLYKGFQTLCSAPASTSEAPAEMLLELSGLVTGGPPVDILGESYVESGRRIDYWSSYYDQSNGGFSFFSPHSGRFFGDYFYRGAQSMFDIHRWTEPSVQIEATTDERWLSSASPDVPEWISLEGDCAAGSASNWQWSASNATGTPPEDPDPIVETLAGNQARVRADLCGTDAYPLSRCPARSIQIAATVDCDGLSTTPSPLNLTLEDPRPFFDAFEILETAFEPGPPPVFLAGQLLIFRTLSGGPPGLAGQPPTSFQWTVRRADGSDATTCDAAGGASGLTCSAMSLNWDTLGVDPDPSVIFKDGFESGDASAWGGTLRGARGVFEIELVLSNAHGTFERTLEIALLD